MSKTVSMRAVLCARVSTDAQAEQGRSLQTQLEAERRYAASHGFEVVDEITDDISGTVPIRQRPGGARLYSYIDGRQCDVVIFYTVDRITRDEDLIEINVIRRDIRNAGMELHYAADGGKTDLSTMGGMIDTLKAAVAAEERKKIVERNMRGRMAKARAGKWVGEGFAPFGYRKIGKLKEAYLEIDEANAATVRRIFGLYLGTGGQLPMSIRAISNMLSAEDLPRPQNGQYWCNRTVGVILKQSAYVGRFKYRDVEIPLPELAIVSESDFNAVQDRMTRNREMSPRNRVHEYLLASRIRCTCGRAMSGRIRQTKYSYYACSNMFLPKVARVCHEPSVRSDALDAQVWNWLMLFLSDEAQLLAGIERLNERCQADSVPLQLRLTEVENQIERAERKLRRLVSALGEADDNEEVAIREESKQTSRGLSALKQERDQIQTNLAHQSWTETDRARNSAQILQIAATLRAGIAEADYPTKRYALEQLNLQCKIIREGDHYMAEVSCGLGANLWPIVTTHPRTVLPATRGPRCDSRPAPRSRGDPWS